MHSEKFKVALLAAVCLTEGVAGSAAFAGSTYTATDLGPGIANAINDSGYIVGELTTTNGTSEPVRWSPSGAVTALQGVGDPGGDQVVGINSTNYAVGYAQKGTGWEAVIWSPSGTATVLQDPGGQGYSQAVGINDAGYVVGYSETAGGGWDAVLWSPNGTGTVLQDLGGAGHSFASAINDSDEIAGYSWTQSTGYFAVEWPPDGPAAAMGSGWSNGINSAGDIVGAGSGGWIVRWHDGTTTILQGTVGLWPGNALAINNSGDSVGGLAGEPGAFDAVVWAPTGTPLVLPDIGGQGRSGATGINSPGDIVGWSGDDAVLWSPAVVPEPSTWAMMLLGFAGLGYLGYRNSRKPVSIAA